jgi:hypothetical protein
MKITKNSYRLDIPLCLRVIKRPSETQLNSKEPQITNFN